MAAVDTLELFQAATEATVVLAASASITVAVAVLPPRRQPRCGAATAPKAVLTPVLNDKDCLVVAASKDVFVAEWAAVAVAAADSIKAASVTHRADVVAAAASVATAAAVVVTADAAVAVGSSQNLLVFVLDLAEESAVASVDHTAAAAVVAADAYVADVALKDASSTTCWLVIQPTLTSDTHRQTPAAHAVT